MKRFNEVFLNQLKQIPINEVAEKLYGMTFDYIKSTKTTYVYRESESDIIRTDNKGNNPRPKIVVNLAKNVFISHNYKNDSYGDIFNFIALKESWDVRTNFPSIVKKLADYVGVVPILDNQNFNTFNFDNSKKFEKLKQKREEIKRQIAKYEKEKNNINWKEVFENIKVNRHYTDDIRGISAELLNYLRNQGKIKYYKTQNYAITKVPLYSNVKTICGIMDIYRNNNGWQKLLNKYSKSGIFYTGNLKNIRSLVLTESFFDALSALQFKYYKERRKNLLYSLDNLNNEVGTIATAGILCDLKTNTILDIIKNSQQLENIVLAFDDDNQGHKYTQEIKKLLEQKEFLDKYNIKIISFHGFKDLNEFLQTKLQSVRPKL